MAIARCFRPPLLRELVRRQTASDAAATLDHHAPRRPHRLRPHPVRRERRRSRHRGAKAATPEQLAIPFINSGIYCFRADLLWKHLVEIRPDNPAHEYYLTDIVEILSRAGHASAAMEVENSAELLGINTRVELAAVDKIFRDRKVRELMLAGVTIEKPETVTIDALRAHRRGFHRGAIRANSRPHRNRRRLPHRRLLHR